METSMTPMLQRQAEQRELIRAVVGAVQDSLAANTVPCKACHMTGKTWGVGGLGYQVCAGCHGAGVHRL